MTIKAVTGPEQSFVQFIAQVSSSSDTLAVEAYIDAVLHRQPNGQPKREGCERLISNVLFIGEETYQEPGARGESKQYRDANPRYTIDFLDALCTMELLS